MSVEPPDGLDNHVEAAAAMVIYADIVMILLRAVDADPDPNAHARQHDRSIRRRSGLRWTAC